MERHVRPTEEIVINAAGAEEEFAQNPSARTPSFTLVSKVVIRMHTFNLKIYHAIYYRIFNYHNDANQRQAMNRGGAMGIRGWPMLLKVTLC